MPDSSNTDANDTRWARFGASPTLGGHVWGAVRVRGGCPKPRDVNATSRPVAPNPGCAALQFPFDQGLRLFMIEKLIQLVAWPLTGAARGDRHYDCRAVRNGHHSGRRPSHRDRAVQALEQRLPLTPQAGRYPVGNWARAGAQP